MKRMAHFAAVSAAVSLLVAVAFGVGGASGAATRSSDLRAAEHHANLILGTWAVEVTPTGEAPFQAMVTFSAGGGLVETESTVPGMGLGSWEPGADDRVAVTFQRFEYNAEGAPAGRTVVRTEITVSGDEFSGPFEFDAFDPAGNVVFSGGGTATGTRFAVQPL
jgi:hypothetical protein